MMPETGDLLDHAPCGFVSFRDDSCIAYVNATLLERLGYAREEILDQPFEKILMLASRIFYQTHFFPLVKLHGRAQEVFLLLEAKGGDVLGVLCNAERRERNGTTFTDCIFMEVQERRKFEDALLEARRAAEEANHAKSNFLAVMSHELRTPLNAISGYVQLLEMGVHGPVTPEQLEALGRIDRSQRHLLRLINDVLNLSRIEAGRVSYAAEQFSLSEVLGSVLPMVEPQLEAKQLRIESAVSADLRTLADQDKVQQILLNLLTNAIKFTPEHGNIRIDAGEYPDRRVYLRVKDSGIGIPPDMIEQIFEPFIQVDSSHSRTHEGTGLGLAISRDLARGMGGDLRADSALRAGSTFVLTLQKA